jgi:MFS family permease
MIIMSQAITDKQRRLSRKYLVFKFLTNLWFISAIWLYFYRIFITDQQVGILDGLAFAIGLIAEVPSGALADRFGRGRMVKLGQALAGSGLLIQAFGSSFLPFFVGQSIMLIGFSLVSGADEALFFENINFDRASLHWRKLVTRCSQAALVGLLTATLIGGRLYFINPRIPWILSGLAMISSVFIIWSVKDNRPKRQAKKFLAEIKGHLIDIKAGFVQFRSPKLFLYVPIIIIVQGLFYTAGWGILRLILLDRFNFDPFWSSVVIATSSLITVGILTLMYRYAERMSERRVLILISICAVVSLLLSIANIGRWGYIVILALYAGEHVLSPFMNEVLNNRAEENQRATVLSVATFFRMLPYVVLAPIIGYLNTHDSLEYFLISWSLLMCAATLFYSLLKKNDDIISMVRK